MSLDNVTVAAVTNVTQNATTVIVCPSDSSGCTLSEEHGKVPIEAVAFLGAVLVFVLLLVIFFLYLNKSLCFSDCGGFPCIDKVPQKDNFLDSDDDDEGDLRNKNDDVVKPEVNVSYEEEDKKRDGNNVVNGVVEKKADVGTNSGGDGKEQLGVGGVSGRHGDVEAGCGLKSGRSVEDGGCSPSSEIQLVTRGQPRDPTRDPTHQHSVLPEVRVTPASRPTDVKHAPRDTRHTGKEKSRRREDELQLKIATVQDSYHRSAYQPAAGDKTSDDNKRHSAPEQPSRKSKDASTSHGTHRVKVKHNQHGGKHHFRVRVPETDV